MRQKKGKIIYLNYASTGLLPEKSAKMVRWVAKHQSLIGTIPKAEWEPVLAELRTYLADLIGSQQEQIALTRNTTEGWHILIEAFPWNPRDEVLISSFSFPSNVVPWQTLKNKAVVKMVPLEYQPGFEEKILTFLSPETRLVSIDWVHFLTGYRVNISQIYLPLHSRGILLAVDGMQGIGALDSRFIAQSCDFCSCGGNKWLLSPWGTGFVYVSPDLFSSLHPAHIGWLSLQWDSFESFSTFPEMYPSARIWESATPNFYGYYAMRESLKYLLSVPAEEKEKLLLARVSFLREELRKRHALFPAEIPPDFSSGIISFRFPNIEMPVLFRLLSEQGVYASLRNNFIRLSPHFSTPMDTLQDFLSILDETLREIR
ncbi:MAG: aminotransferase class V-fold PLP-dependent enzyme [bacterium JZ-2024 1]